MNRTTLLKGVVLAVGLIGTASAAWPSSEGPQIFGDTTFNGSYVQTHTRGRQPFVLQVFSNPGNCLNLQVTSEDSDLHMAVIGPAGHVWRNDDSGGACSSCPRVKIDPTPTASGWYTLHISRFGDGPAGSLENFTLLMQEQPSGDAACTTPTPTEGPARGDKE